MTFSYIGIDISKTKFDAYWNGHRWQIQQTEKAIDQFINELVMLLKKEGMAPLFVCEPTGGYEHCLVSAVRSKGLGYHVAHANKVKAFARSKGLLAKTDKIDARTIADYAQLMQVMPDKLKSSENREKIADFVKRREQLMDMRQQEVNRLDKLIDKEVIALIKAHIKWLETAIKKIENGLNELTKCDDVKTDIELLTSVQGIGNLTALYLIAFLPELGNASDKQLAALVGVAPYNHDSGKYRGKRFIQGGRHTVRHALYMAAVASIKWNAELAGFYRRLVNRGKPPKVALIAVVRKMICLLNAILRRQTPWIKKELLAAS